MRAFQPWPVCRTSWRGRQLRIISARPLPGEAGVGELVAVSDPDISFGVGTGQGVLGVTEVQLEGKRVMAAGEFLKGQRDFMGSILPG